ncbi:MULTISPECIES: OmpA/MotB family protein [Cellulophaga]|jgi:chemotaxis protein MotB|uniref:Cell envelope biogenesis protein OmpA n=1 Tax=Cellulophaga baltica 18 TaxID=1348584 RepID=A0AAU8RIJ9_9FLAO|nr:MULTISPECIES: OmpA family protein [Cellulophaga]WFO16435.1 OmpA family protein [Cellulophaga baltica 4]AIY14717.1 cell envelope biogenesis protein OmpA [Cellulophaga baltica NN016038]AIZ43091.1 cell envelope biogenesis protein OmpA [Cellulophaga baltica 18]KGK31593.1 cell envelope biogenesis protein OmpA [Cellulophaga sp. E6(2014)]MBA6315634.1 OmpA family protein [Cellulophaga baltica]
MKKLSVITIVSIVALSSCVSKKKYVALESDLNNTKSILTKTQVEKEDLEAKMTKIEARVTEYNDKINSLKEVNDSQYSSVDDIAVMSNNTKEKMKATLSKVDPALLANAKTMEDSINLAISYNLKKSISDDEDDVNIDIDKTVVMINISDKLLFNSGSYTVSNKANNILKKIADVINSEPSMEVMVEGHTDSRTIQTPMFQDNWDLSVKRATSVVRILQNKYKVAPEKLIASGRSSYLPLVENDSKENRSKNRRTRIVIIPNLDKFFALLDSEGL